MKFTAFLKDKIMGTLLLIFALITIEIFLMIYSFDNFMKIYIPIIIFVCYFSGLFLEYMTKKKYYDNDR